MAAPIKLGSAAQSLLIFQKGSKITTSGSGVQSCSIQALYGDAQNVFAVLPAAGTPFNVVFGNSYLPPDFKVDITGGGYDIEYVEGKAARVTINFKRPDPTQPPGPNGQRSRKVSVDTSIAYKDLQSYSVVGISGALTLGGTGDERNLRYGFPEPVVTVTYNIDTVPRLSTALAALFAQPGDIRTLGFPDVSNILTPLALPAFAGMTITYFANGQVVVDGPLTQDYTYNFNLVYSPNPLGWKITRFKYEPHADESFFDVEENWQNYYSVSGAVFVSRVRR